MTYKPEIDGLRAVGVLLVLFTHMQLGISGGYIGVDVFFVISGFLITSIILNGIEQQRFSFLSFYGRRFMRLYPALIIVIAISFLLSCLLFEPAFLELIARSAKYAITSTSNVFYNRMHGYFDPASQKQVFLHTWSLGVEWQFYILWPLIAWVTLKFFSKRVFTCLLFAITIGSLLASQWVLKTDMTSAYYQMPYRAFELGTGALLALFYDRKAPTGVLIGLAYAGLLAIFIPAFIYTPETLFPGFAAFIPCLGAAAFIYGGKNAIGGALLRLKPIVYIGQISYSVYLVHWPLLIIYNNYVFRDLILAERISLTLLSLALGSLLYHGVETKINWRSVKHRGMTSGAMLGITVAMVAVFQYASHTDKGLFWRVPQTHLLSSQFTTWGGGESVKKIRLGQPDEPLQALIAGDSFSGSMASGVDAYSIEHQIAVELTFSPGCVITAVENPNDECSHVAYNAITKSKELKIPLILIESWGAQFSDYFLVSPGAQGGNTPEKYQAFTYKNLDEIHQKIGLDNALILVGSVPYHRWGAGELECLTRPQVLPLACNKQLGDYAPADLPIHQINMMLKQYTEQHQNAYYIATDEAACPDQVCTRDQNAELYSDGFHLSVNGSIIVGEIMMKEIMQTIQKHNNSKISETTL